MIFGLMGMTAMLIGCSLLNNSYFCFYERWIILKHYVAIYFLIVIAGLGKYTSQGSAFLVMMILGGELFRHYKENWQISSNSCFIYSCLFCIHRILRLESNGILEKGIGKEIEVEEDINFIQTNQNQTKKIPFQI
jgi:FHS family L-fucose permease-like MFS transporter